MATYTKASGYYTLSLDVTQSSQSTANNTSTLTLTIKLITGSTYFSDVRVGYKAAVTGGTPNPAVNVGYSSAAQISMQKNQTKTLWTGTVTVAHNSDGTKTLAAGAITAQLQTQTGNIVPNISLSNSTALTLTTIPRQSTITTTASSNVMGTARTISIARNSSSYTHTLTYAFGSATGTIATKTTSTSVSWTVPTSLAAQVATGSVQSTGTIYCKTYSGDTQIGSTTSATFTAKIPVSTVALGATSVAMGKAQTFTITRASTNLNHKITYTFGSTSGTAVSSATTSASWPVPTTFVGQLTNAASGTCTVVIETYNGTTSTAAAKVGSVTKTFTATIPASAVAAPSAAITMGTEGTVTITTINSALRHTVTYTFGSASGTIATTTASTSLRFTPPTTLTAQVAAGNSQGSGTITCETFNGTKSCGKTTATFSAKIPSADFSGNKTSLTMGAVIRFTMTGTGSNLSYKLTYNFASGAKTGTIVSSTTAGTYDWTVPTSLAAYVPTNYNSASCVVTCTTYNGTASCGTATHTISTVTIPKSALTLSATSVTFGSTTGVTLTVSPAANTLTHTFQYSMDNSTWTTLGTAKTSDTSYTWKPTAAQAANVTGASVTWYVRAITYNGTASPGTDTKSITMKVSNSGDTAAPTITLSAQSTTTTPSAFSGLYIQGYSSVKATLSITPHNAKIVSYTYKIGSVTRKTASGQSLSSYSATDTYALGTSGTFSLTFTCTDSHGFSSSATAVSITVQAYSLPKLKPRGNNSKIIVARSNGSTVTSDGTYLHLEFGFTHSQIKNASNAQRNWARAQYKIGSGSWTNVGDSTTDASYDVPVQNINAGLDAASVYTVQLRVYDSFTGDSGSGTTTTQTYTIPTDNIAVNVEHLTSGSGTSQITDDAIGIGMYAQYARRVDLGWEVLFNQGIYPDRFYARKSATSGGRSRIVVVENLNYTDMGVETGITTGTLLSAWLTKICTDYASTDYGHTLFMGRMTPGSRAFIFCYIYETYTTQDGLPQYCHGIYFPYSSASNDKSRGTMYRFGTANYAFWTEQYMPYKTMTPTLTYVQNDIVDSTNFGQIVCRNEGKVVSLRINITTTATSTGTTWTQIGTVPTGYRPGEWYYVNFPGETATFYRGALRVGTAGEIQIYKNNTNAMTIRQTLTYIMA